MRSRPKCQVETFGDLIKEVAKIEIDTNDFYQFSQLVFELREMLYPRFSEKEFIEKIWQLKDFYNKYSIVKKPKPFFKGKKRLGDVEKVHKKMNMVTGEYY